MVHDNITFSSPHHSTFHSTWGDAFCCSLLCQFPQVRNTWTRVHVVVFWFNRQVSWVKHFCFEHLPSLPLQCVCPLNCVVRREEEWRRMKKGEEEYGGVSWQCVPCRHYVFMGTRAAAWILYGWQNGSSHHFISRGRSYSVNYVWKLYWNAPSVCSWLVLAVLLLWFLFIRYQISSLCCRTYVGANEPLELASGELQLETTRVTEKCV